MAPNPWLTETITSNYAAHTYLNSELDLDDLVPPENITDSAQAQFLINFTTPDTYTVWLRGYAPNTNGDSAYLGLGTDRVEITGFTPQQWSWASASVNLVITQTGLITLNLHMREDGLRIDRLLLITDTAFVPVDFGPLESDRYTAGMPLPETLLTRTIVYPYDNLYRLTDADYSTSENYVYQYDEVDNRLQQIINGEYDQLRL